MIKKLFCISIITCVVMCFNGCDNRATEPVSATEDKQSDSTIIEEITTDESTTEPITEPQNEPTSEPITEPTTDKDADKSQVCSDDMYEQFENFKIKKMYLSMKTTVGINVRKGPDETYERVDGLKKEQDVNVIGQCVETGWYMVSLNGVKGFVSNQFLVASEGDSTLVLGDECPYKMYTKMEYNGQMGWFYRVELGWQPLEYKNILKELTEAGYTVENFPVYVGTWRDVGNLMWLGYSKK